MIISALLQGPFLFLYTLCLPFSRKQAPEVVYYIFEEVKKLDADWRLVLLRGATKPGPFNQMRTSPHCGSLYDFYPYTVSLIFICIQNIYTNQPVTNELHMASKIALSAHKARGILDPCFSIGISPRTLLSSEILPCAGKHSLFWVVVLPN